MAKPTSLRVEHLHEPLGITVAAPRLSWWLPPAAASQRAFQLEFDGEPQPPVESDSSVLVPWPLEPLGSRSRIDWRVKVWTEAGESEWSAPTWFETGLMDPADWQARWIEPYEPAVSPAGERPGHVLRHDFDLPGVADSRLYATAHGIYEIFLNGSRVGDVELAPGFTSYPANLHVQTYDVSALLRRGANRIDVILSDGWYRGRNGFIQKADCYGETVAFLGQLECGDTTICSGPDWSSATGAVLSADLMAGQTVDFRCAPETWQPVEVVDHDMTCLSASPAPPTRRVEQIQPTSVTRPAPDRQVIDLGQNINGWLRLSNLGPAGAELTLTHGEALGPDGDVTLEHLGGVDWRTGDPNPAIQVDRVSAADANQVFEPRHTIHGFQYVRVEGHPDRLTPDDALGVVVHTDLRRTGWFRCSDDRINRLHDATVWSFRGNACEIPTDCPQRERSGWTGDYQAFIPAAAFLFDVAGFSVKWLRDLMADARADGCLPNFAPDPARPKALPAEDPMWTMLQGSSGWGDAMTIVPWELWRSYGDAEILAECLPAMVRWVDFAAGAARTHRHPSRAERGEPEPHEAFLWDGGFHWGEWHEPGAEEASFEERFGAHQGEIGTAYLHLSASIVARVSAMVGGEAEAARFEELAAESLAAWRTEFIGPSGSLTPDTQANHVRALAFDLVPPELRDQTAARLVELIREAGTHLGTGFLATPLLLPALADSGYLDVAYELLLQDTPPSWLAMIERGATTVWESWTGIRDDGTPEASLNHYSKGAVVTFLHTHVAGIHMLDEPAYNRFAIKPRPGGHLSWAEAVHDSPYGRIESSWRIRDRRFELTVSVPPGTQADVTLPDGSHFEAMPGSTSYSCEHDQVRAGA